MTPRQQLLFGVIADDDSGASDEAGMLHEAGARTILSIGIPSEDDLATWRDRYDAVVVATHTRAMPAAEAYRITREATSCLHAAGVSRFQVKYCSTFDSTPQGNIGPSIDAALDELDDRFTIAVPALPVNGRTTYCGYHFVNGVLLSESPMRDHPLTPMTDANLVRWLSRQTNRPVGLASLMAVRSGAAALREEFARLRAAGLQIAIVDCVSPQDMGEIAAASADFQLTTGSSGLGMAFPAIWRNSGWVSRVSWEGNRSVLARPEACLIVAGSCSEATRRQNQEAIESGILHFPIDPFELLDGRVDRVRITAQLRAGETLLVSTSADPDTVAAVRMGAARRSLTPASLGERIATATGELTAALVAETGVRRLIVAGGETSGSVCRALGVSALEILGNIDPGVPLCRSGLLLMVLKSGNFGSPEFYRKSLERMNTHSATASVV